jgi:nucleoid-associated protein YgaU
VGRHSRGHGRHRAPSQTGRVAARVAAAGAVLAGPLVAAGPAQAGPPGGWGPIISCESGGRNIEHGGDAGGVSTASGIFQFVNGTWLRFGGAEFAPRAIDATAAEQTIVADRAYAANGLSDWDSSRACWQGRIDSSKHASEQKPPRHARAAAPRHAKRGTSYTIQPGDTLADIAAAHHTTWPRLFAANRTTIANPNRIQAGVRIDI